MDETTPTPTFNFDNIDLASVKEALGAIDVDLSQEQPVPVERPRRRQGRPPGSRNRATIEREEAELPGSGFNLKLDPAPLGKREEKEVAKRIVNILTGATGMASVAKPYLLMTDEEAEAIAEPLASYLVRNESTQGVAREILENYDLLAMTLGMGAYSVRIYKDRKNEVATQRPVNTTAVQRVSDLPHGDNGRQPDERVSSEVSITDVTRGSRAPFDL